MDMYDDYHPDNFLGHYAIVELLPHAVGKLNVVVWTYNGSGRYHVMYTKAVEKHRDKVRVIKAGKYGEMMKLCETMNEVAHKFE